MIIDYFFNNCKLKKIKIMILFILTIVFFYVYFEIKFDYTKEKKLLVWYTHNKERKYYVLW